MACSVAPRLMAKEQVCAVQYGHPAARLEAYMANPIIDFNDLRPKSVLGKLNMLGTRTL
jgi:hypothetical protein